MCIFVSVCWCGEQVSKIHWPVVSVVHDPFAGDDDEDTDYDAAVVGGGHVHGEDDEDEDEDDEEDDHLAHASADTSSVGVSVLERPFPLSNVSPPPFQKNRMFFLCKRVSDHEVPLSHCMHCGINIFSLALHDITAV